MKKEIITKYCYTCSHKESIIGTLCDTCGKQLSINGYIVRQISSKMPIKL